ncbi:enterochelin esterase [Marinomonas aquiplantarum]|uniref:enterochelin esterase n=1 Tax=Marinomonas aquiplantarum TaxID=491951 RepID=UPI001FECA4DD|nr:enterochelin esterase [Marinomonas aquiplantarum]
MMGLNAKLVFWENVESVGSHLWWERFKALGSPFLITQDRVQFLWRDPQGNENSSDVACVILDVNSVTNHHTWSPKCLQRVRGTDVWFAELHIDSHWRGSYSFIPLTADQLPDIVKKQGDGSVQAQRNWWISIASQQTADPLNPLPVLNSGWGESSALHMPNASKEAGWEDWDKGNLPRVINELIKTFCWKSKRLGNERNCQLYSTAKGEAPLVILLDGQRWGAESGCLSVLDFLTSQEQLRPAHYLLVPSIDSATRWQELSCYRPFWEAVHNELLPDLINHLGHSACSISEYVVAGQSLGGLSSLYAGLTFPERYKKVISLSGSFWWPEVNRMHASHLDKTILTSPPEGGLTEALESKILNAEHLSVYQSVGSGEADMCLYNGQMFHALRNSNANVFYHVFCGGHDWLSWRSGLVEGLRHLLQEKSNA